VLPRQYEAFSLHVRQNGGSSSNTLDSVCLYACDVNSCGDTCAPVRKRDFFPLGHPERPHRLWNETTDEWYTVSADQYNATISRRGNEKRAFTNNPRWNKWRVALYLPGQIQIINGVVVPADTQFPNNLGFFIGGTNQGTVSQQAAFGNFPIQMGTGGLHGCTMLAVISNRGVFMVRSPLAPPCHCLVD
jgi:hypothetical protein